MNWEPGDLPYTAEPSFMDKKAFLGVTKKAFCFLNREK